MSVVRKQVLRESSEAQLLAQLRGRNHVAELLHASATHLWLPYYPDRAVRSFAEAARLVADVGAALAYLHATGWVHRDVKRPNVRFGDQGAVLIDFDLALPWRQGDAPLTRWGGTPGWRAPEVNARQPYTCSVDMWGLGLVLLDEVNFNLLHYGFHGACS